MKIQNETNVMTKNKYILNLMLKKQSEEKKQKEAVENILQRQEKLFNKINSSKNDPSKKKPVISCLPGWTLDQNIKSTGSYGKKYTDVVHFNRLSDNEKEKQNGLNNPSYNGSNNGSIRSITKKGYYLPSVNKNSDMRKSRQSANSSYSRSR